MNIISRFIVTQYFGTSKVIELSFPTLMCWCWSQTASHSESAASAAFMVPVRPYLRVMYGCWCKYVKFDWWRFCFLCTDGSYQTLSMFQVYRFRHWSANADDG